MKESNQVNLGVLPDERKFGYSLIAVEVTPENEIASITSRWNTRAGNSGNFIKEDELGMVLGEENFGKLFCWNY